MKISLKLLTIVVLESTISFNNPLYCMDKTNKSQYYIDKENKYNYVKKENKYNKYEKDKLINEIYYTSGDEYDNDEYDDDYSSEFENDDNYLKKLSSNNKENKFHYAQKENKYKKCDISNLSQQTKVIHDGGKLKNKLQQQNIITNEKSKQKLNIDTHTCKDNELFTSLENTINNIKLNNDNNIKLNNIVNNINNCKNDIIIKQSNNTNEINNKISEKKRIELEEKLLKETNNIKLNNDNNIKLNNIVNNINNCKNDIIIKQSNNTNEINNKILEKKRIEEKLLTDIKKMYNTYYDNDEISEEENKELIKEIYNYLFGNNCHNLKISFGVEEALEKILTFLQDDDIKDYFINSFKSKDDNELNTISNAFNNNIPYNSEEYNNIKYYINYYIHQGRLMRLLNMDITFKKMLDDCSNACRENNDTNIREYGKQFCDYLLGDDGRNLEIILSNNNIKYALNDISELLQLDYHIDEYLYEKLKDNNVCNRISTIVNNILGRYHNSNEVSNIIDNIKSCIFLKLLGMDVTFYAMWVNGLNNKNEIEQFYNVLFGNNGKNLELILFCDCREAKYVYEILKEQKVIDYLPGFLENNNIKSKISKKYIDNDVLYCTALKFKYILYTEGNSRDKILDIINEGFQKSEGISWD